MFRTLPHFEYLSPKSLEEALSLLAQYGSKAKVLAGGTDLIPQMKWGEHNPDVLIAINRISELGRMEYDERNGLRLGAACKIAQASLAAFLPKERSN